VAVVARQRVRARVADELVVVRRPGRVLDARELVGALPGRGSLLEIDAHCARAEEIAHRVRRAGPGVDRVVPAAAGDELVAGPAVERVAAAAALQLVGARTAEERARAAAHQAVGPSRSGVHAAAAGATRDD